MKSKLSIWMRAAQAAAMAFCLTAAVAGAPFGKVVAIGGHAADIALDEARGVLYIANFTANRIDVMSLGDHSIQSSINVPAQPSSLSVSPDGKYLVITHYGNTEAPTAPTNGLTIVNLETRARRTMAIGSAPLGVAFGIDGKAFVGTATEFLLLDPATGGTQALDTIAGLALKTIPQPPASFPTNITTTSIASSQDGLWIYGSTERFEYGYDVRNRKVTASFYTSVPPFGPRSMSVSADGSFFVHGWARMERDFSMSSQFPNPVGTFHVGGNVIDSSRNLIYGQMPEVVATGPNVALPSPVLQVLDADNLGVLERFNLAENLAGKGVISGDNNTVYVISDSGVTILPVGAMDRVRRLRASTEDVVFRGNFCDRRASTQEFTIVDQSGGNTDFSISSSNPAVRISPSTGITPARIRVSVDPSGFANQKGTTAVTLSLTSRGAVNLPDPVRVLVNTREPDQRGSFVNIPGKLVDVLADPVRDRFFVLRQDKNQVLVFDGSTFKQIATLKTGNTPTQLAVSFDRRYLLVGSDNSQVIPVFDLETLERLPSLRMPSGHYPRSIASSGNATLVASRVFGPEHKISRVDFATRTVSVLATLGVYENNININTVMTASPNGASIFIAQADGNVMLYNAASDTFSVSRKDATALSGAFAASNRDEFIVDNRVLNASLVTIRQLETGTGVSSGFAFVDGQAIRLTAPNASAAGVIQRVDVQSGDSIRATRLVEAPLLTEGAPAQSGTTTPGSGTGSTNTNPNETTYRVVFTRTIAPLASRQALVALTTSGITALPWVYDSAVAPPRIERVVNAADFSAPVAPGGLISVFGSDLSPVSQASAGTPLPTALGDSCLTVNGQALPVIYVSPAQINAQLPIAVDGNTTLRLNTPGGVSDNFNIVIQPTAPSVFRTAGGDGAVPSVVRAENNGLVTVSNPVHRDDLLTIYATGLGRTSPSVEAGEAAPMDELAVAVVQPIVTIGGIPVEVLFAGLAPGQIGVYQINVRVNAQVPLGLSVPLQVQQGTGSTSLNVRVVN